MSDENYPELSTNTSALGQNIPYWKTWLDGLDPATFTPITLALGRETTIRISDPDNYRKVNIARIITHFTDGERELVDEAYDITGRSAAGDQTVSQLKYKFSASGGLKEKPTCADSGEGPGLDRWTNEYSPSPILSSILETIAKIRTIEGSTIRADNYRHGAECHFISDGKVWHDSTTERGSAHIAHLLKSAVKISPINLSLPE